MSEDVKSELRDRSCLVGGHNFLQHGKELIDTAASQISNPKHVRVRFDSRQFFDLLARYPKTFLAFKGARHVTLAVGDTIYEVHE